MKNKNKKLSLKNQKKKKKVFPVLALGLQLYKMQDFVTGVQDLGFCATK